MIPVEITDFTEPALELLTQRFKGKPVITGLLSSLTAKVEDLEAVLWDVINKRLITNNPVGDQLDQLGAIVGEKRDSRSDADYFPAVQVRIKVNRSQGRAEDVLQVAHLLFTGTWTYAEFPAMGFYITALDITGAISILRLIGQTRAAASRGVLVYSTWPTGTDFIFSSTTGSVTGSRGMSDSISGTLVSKLTSSQEFTP